MNKIKIYNNEINLVGERKLSDAFIARIINYKEYLKEVETTPLETIIEDFGRDMYPEIELEHWERLTKKYLQIIENTPTLDLQEKREIYEELLDEFFG